MKKVLSFFGCLAVWFFLRGGNALFSSKVSFRGSSDTSKCNWTPTRALESVPGIFCLAVTRHTTIKLTHSQNALVNYFVKRPEYLCYNSSLESLKSLTLHNSFINLLNLMTWPPKYFMVTLLTVIWGVHHTHTHTHICRKTHSCLQAMGLQTMKTNWKPDLKLYAH